MKIVYNKMGLKDQVEDTIVDWEEDIVNLLQETDPKKWRKAIDLLQKSFERTTEVILDSMYDEIGWND